jgi:hypothetical protein
VILVDVLKHVPSLHDLVIADAVDAYDPLAAHEGWYPSALMAACGPLLRRTVPGVSDPLRK